MVSKEKDTKKNNEKGYREPKGLNGKAPRHEKTALETKFKKEQISDGIDIIPEKELVPCDKKPEEETITLRFEDSDKFLDAVKEFEDKNGIMPLDFDEDSFVVAVAKEKVDMFRDFMSEKHIEEIMDTEEIDDKIAEVQNGRSSLALLKDKSMTSSRVGNKNNPDDLKDWLKNPNKLDLDNIDTKNH